MGRTGIDTALTRAVAKKLSADKRTPIVERVLVDAQAVDPKAREFRFDCEVDDAVW